MSAEEALAIARKEGIDILYKRSSGKESGYKGVFEYQKDGDPLRYRAKIKRPGGMAEVLGCFDTEEEAALVYSREMAKQEAEVLRFMAIDQAAQKTRDDEEAQKAAREQAEEAVKRQQAEAMAEQEEKEAKEAREAKEALAVHEAAQKAAAQEAEAAAQALVEAQAAAKASAERAEAAKVAADALAEKAAAAAAAAAVPPPKDEAAAVAVPLPKEAASSPQEIAEAAEQAALNELIDKEMSGWEMDLPSDDDLMAMEMELDLQDDFFDASDIALPLGGDAQPAAEAPAVDEPETEPDEEDGPPSSGIEDEFPVITKRERKEQAPGGRPLLGRRKPSDEEIARVKQAAQDLEEDTVPASVLAFTKLAAAKERMEAAEVAEAKASKDVAATRAKVSSKGPANGGATCEVGSYVPAPDDIEDEFKEIELSCDDQEEVNAYDEDLKSPYGGGYGASTYEGDDDDREEEEEDGGGWMPTFGRRSLEAKRRRRRLSAVVGRTDTWAILWHERVMCWYLGLPLPTQTQLGNCMGALSLSLGSKLDGAWRAAQTLAGRTPPAASAPVAGAAEPGCEWLTEGSLRMPEHPAFPSDFDFTLPPIPRLLPSWQQLQSLERGPAYEWAHLSIGGIGEGAQNIPLAVQASAPAEQQAGWSALAAGSGLGVLAGAGLTLGVFFVRRRGGRPDFRSQNKRPRQDKHPESSRGTKGKEELPHY